MEFQDPMDGHFASGIWHGCLRLWCIRLDISIWKVETSPAAGNPRGLELAVHLWRIPR